MNWKTRFITLMLPALALTAPVAAQEGRGDVVYVPRQTWHLASFGGEPGLRSCRLAMNGFPYQAHMFEAD